MTSEHRLVFDVEDIKVLRLECTKCRASISVPIDQRLRVPDQCPACGAVLNDRFKPGVASEIESVAGVLRTIAAAIAASKDSQPVRLRFEFNAP